MGGLYAFTPTMILDLTRTSANETSSEDISLISFFLHENIKLNSKITAKKTAFEFNLLRIKLIYHSIRKL